MSWENVIQKELTPRQFPNDDEDKVIFAGSDVFTFDLDGFLTSRSIASGAYSGNATFDYSSRGELLSANLPDGRVISYAHDPMGRRVAKSINGVVVEKYLWQGATTLLAVYDGVGNLIQRFEYADGRMPVAVAQSGQVFYLGYDQVGSLRVVADSAGNIPKKIDYDSFGNILSDSNPSFSVPFGFAGGLHDRDTGLVRFGARDYDPATGKWTAKDPIDFGGGDLNLFEYCLENPVNAVDIGGFFQDKSDDFYQGSSWFERMLWRPTDTRYTFWEWDSTGTHPPSEFISAGHVGNVDVYWRNRKHFEQRGRWVWELTEHNRKWGYEWGEKTATTRGFVLPYGTIHAADIIAPKPKESPSPCD